MSRYNQYTLPLAELLDLMASSEDAVLRVRKQHVLNATGVSLLLTDQKTIRAERMVPQQVIDLQFNHALTDSLIRIVNEISDLKLRVYSV